MPAEELRYMYLTMCFSCCVGLVCVDLSYLSGGRAVEVCIRILYFSLRCMSRVCSFVTCRRFEHGQSLLRAVYMRFLFRGKGGICLIVSELDEYMVCNIGCLPEDCAICTRPVRWVVSISYSMPARSNQKAFTHSLKLCRNKTSD